MGEGFGRGRRGEEGREVGVDGLIRTFFRRLSISQYWIVGSDPRRGLGERNSRAPFLLKRARRVDAYFALSRFPASVETRDERQKYTVS